MVKIVHASRQYYHRLWDRCALRCRILTCCAEMHQDQRLCVSLCVIHLEQQHSCHSSSCSRTSSFAPALSRFADAAFRPPGQLHSACSLELPDLERRYLHTQEPTSGVTLFWRWSPCHGPTASSYQRAAPPLCTHKDMDWCVPALFWF